MSDKGHIKDGKLSVSFGIQDATKEAFDRVERERIVEMLTEQEVGFGDLAWRLRQVYVAAGSPCGRGPEGLVEWIMQG